MSAEKRNGCDNTEHGAATRLDRSAAEALASGIRTCLQFHQLLGVECYPLTPDLHKSLADRGGDHTLSEDFMPTQPPLPSVLSVKPPSVDMTEISGRLACLHRDIAGCRLCALVSARQGQVLGAGAITARLLVIGDYSSQGEGDGFLPTTLFGVAEDAMLWNMMRAIGLKPEEVYVTNTVKCCPQTLQQPKKESELCSLSYLHKEIELIQPQSICAMGEAAARSVLGGDEPVVRLRGRFHRYRYGGEAGSRIQVMVTFHPRFLLKSGDMKKAAWKDLQMIQRQLQGR